MLHRLLFAVLSLSLILPDVASAQSLAVEFISFDAAKPVLEGFADNLPQELKTSGAQLDAQKWSAWVNASDGKIRRRLIRGEEDTLTNLLRFGVTFTKEYRIEDEYLVRYGQSSLVDSFANTRANDLIRALAAPHPAPGIAEMRDFLLAQGYSFKTPADRAKVKTYLRANLARERDDFLKYRAQKKDESRFQLFQDRGISLDSNLWPDYALDVAFRKLAEKGLLKPGSIRRIAIVGPGLDFVNKEAGVDFYPPQVVQPFVVLDSLLRLGLADASSVELFTFDISPSVNSHVARIRQQAKSGSPYVVQLPWNAQKPLSEEYRAAFTAYWQKLGAQIGDPVKAIAVPASVTGTQMRAIKIKPQVAARITPVDTNIIYQRPLLAPEQKFDLVIGTNIFVYYGAFEQSLARANVSAMLKPGGLLLTNDKLPDTVPSGMADVLDVAVTVSQQPFISDTIFCYRR